MPLYLFYTIVQKSQKWPKLKSRGGVLPAVKEWPAPTSVTEVRRFLGFTNFFRRLIKDDSVIARPLM